jgi:hypothetical protein
VDYNRRMVTFSTQRWKQIQLVLFAVLVFVWPSNLFLKFAEPTAYVNGLLVDYLLPKLYLSDLVIVGLFVAWIGEWRSKKKRAVQKPQVGLVKTLIGSLVVLFCLTQLLVSSKPLSTVWFLVKLGEMFTLSCWIWGHRQVLRERVVLYAILAMSYVQSIIALLQLITQRSVFPSYLWMGETRLEHYAGIARSTFLNQELVLPYGTTSHPNILAGVLAITTVILLINLRRRKATETQLQKIVIICGCLLATLTVFLTQSWSAVAVLSIGSAVLFFSRIFSTLSQMTLIKVLLATTILVPLLISIVLPLNNSQSLRRRAWLNQAAVRLWVQSPLAGIGVNTFTARVEEVTERSEVVRFVQPAHHVPLLILSEVGSTGIIVLGISVFICMKLKRKTLRKLLPKEAALVCFILSPVLTLDHYLWTNQVGQLIVVIGGVWLYFNFKELMVRQE